MLQTQGTVPFRTPESVVHRSWAACILGAWILRQLPDGHMCCEELGTELALGHAWPCLAERQGGDWQGVVNQQSGPNGRGGFSLPLPGKAVQEAKIAGESHGLPTGETALTLPPPPAEQMLAPWRDPGSPSPPALQPVR